MDIESGTGAAKAVRKGAAVVPLAAARQRSRPIAAVESSPQDACMFIVSLCSEPLSTLCFDRIWQPVFVRRQVLYITCDDPEEAAR